MASEYLSNVGRRDRFIGAVEFAAMFAGGAALKAGAKDLGEGLGNFSLMTYQYRAMTRLLALVDMNPAARYKAIWNDKAASLPGKLLSTLDLTLDVAFLLCEHFAVYARSGCFSSKAKGDRIGGVGVLLWFYSLVLKLGHTAYDLMLTYPYVPSGKTNDSTSLRYKAKFRRLQLTAAKLVAFILFNLTVLPRSGKAELLGAGAEASLLYPVHRALVAMTPRILNVSPLVMGTFGGAATVIDYIM